MITQQFFCHYTGRDGHTPRRRRQSLVFFDHVPVLGNFTTSSTPLWVEVISDTRPVSKHFSSDPKFYMLHVQLSSDVAVYVEYYFTSGTLSVLNSPPIPSWSHDEGARIVADISRDAIAELHQFLDFTSYLLSHPDKITPPVLNAYREARPSEYKQLLSIINH